MGNVCIRSTSQQQKAIADEIHADSHPGDTQQVAGESQRGSGSRASSRHSTLGSRRGASERRSQSIRFNLDEPEGVEAMVRNFARKSLSFEEPRPRKRRESHIEDRDVLDLMTSKSSQPAEYDEIQKLHLENMRTLDDVREVAPNLAQRVETRRKTMEKLDVFSPDTAPDRLEELYDATERLIREVPGHD